MFFLSKRGKDLIHAKNMILVAAADSVIKDEEMIIISNIFNRMDIPHETFEKALCELDGEGKIWISGDEISLTGEAIKSIEVIPVKSLKEKLHVLADYVLIMMSDGSINEREKELCYAIAHKMGLQPLFVDSTIVAIGKRTGGYGTELEDDNDLF